MIIKSEDIQDWVNGYDDEEPIKHALLELLKHRESNKIELPQVEKWRSVDQVRAQMAYRLLVEKMLNADGFEVKP